MRGFLTFLIDIIFPSTSEEIALRSLSPASFLEKVRRAPPSPFPFIECLFAYKDPLVSELIWQIKSKENKHAFECGAYALYQKIQEFSKEKQSKENSPIILIPIPISKIRRRERGYNQCELLIDHILALEDKSVGERKNERRFEKRFDILARSKHTGEKQAFKNRKERLESSDEIFSAEIIPELLSSSIIIIDDVVTTGSTINEARKTLLKKGYVDVRVLALAH